MFPEVWERLVCGNYRHEFARVSGFRRTVIKHHLYPVAFSASTDDSIEGRVYWHVRPADLAQLDRFEGDFYARQLVSLILANGQCETAQMYVLRKKYALLASDREWSPEYFAKHQLKKFLRTYR